MDTDKIYAEAIANEYSVKNTPQVVALKKLDHKAKMPAQIFAYTFGIAAALVLGVGMCLSMGVIGTGMSYAFQLGIVLGIIGIVGASVDYPLYKRFLKNGKDKYAADIIRLAGEINAG